MMGERAVSQESLFYSFVDLSNLREQLRPFYSERGRPTSHRDHHGRIAITKGWASPGLRLNGSLRAELLNGEIFYSLVEANVLIEAWRRHYNTVRPHSSLGYRLPAPETATPGLIH
jgi:transposase InsO family protein